MNASSDLGLWATRMVVLMVGTYAREEGRGTSDEERDAAGAFRARNRLTRPSSLVTRPVLSKHPPLPLFSAPCQPTRAEAPGLHGSIRPLARSRPARWANSPAVTIGGTCC